MDPSRPVVGGVRAQADTRCPQLKPDCVSHGTSKHERYGTSSGRPHPTRITGHEYSGQKNQWVWDVLSPDI